jgi:hypothetical protein
MTLFRRRPRSIYNAADAVGLVVVVSKAGRPAVPRPPLVREDGEQCIALFALLPNAADVPLSPSRPCASPAAARVTNGAANALHLISPSCLVASVGRRRNRNSNMAGNARRQLRRTGGGPKHQFRWTYGLCPCSVAAPVIPGAAGKSARNIRPRGRGSFSNHHTTCPFLLFFPAPHWRQLLFTSTKLQFNEGYRTCS